MKAEELIQSVSELVAENHQLHARIERLEKETSFDVQKFYGVALTTDVVAKLHNVSTGVVRKYVSLGLIDVHPMSSEKKILINATDALMLDFKELKLKAKSL